MLLTCNFFVLLFHNIVNFLVKRVNPCSEEKHLKRAYKKSEGPCTRTCSDRVDLDKILWKKLSLWGWWGTERGVGASLLEVSMASLDWLWATQSSERGWNFKVLSNHPMIPWPWRKKDKVYHCTPLDACKFSGPQNTAANIQKTNIKNPIKYM